MVRKTYWRTRRLSKMVNRKLFHPDVCRYRLTPLRQWNKECKWKKGRGVGRFLQKVTSFILRATGSHQSMQHSGVTDLRFRKNMDSCEKSGWEIARLGRKIC